MRSNRRSVFLFFLLALVWSPAITVACAGGAEIPVAARSGDTTSIPTAAPTVTPTMAPRETYVAVAALASPTAVASIDGRLGPGLHDFTLPDAHGGQVTLSQYLGDKIVVLAFYRAWW